MPDLFVFSSLLKTLFQKEFCVNLRDHSTPIYGPFEWLLMSLLLFPVIKILQKERTGTPYYSLHTTVLDWPIFLNKLIVLLYMHKIKPPPVHLPSSVSDPCGLKMILASSSVMFRDDARSLPVGSFMKIMRC